MNLGIKSLKKETIMSKRIATTVKINSDLHQRIKIYCVKNDKTMNDFYEEALQYYMYSNETTIKDEMDNLKSELKSGTDRI